MAQQGEAAPRPLLAAADERLALSVLRRSRKTGGKDRRCVTCGLLFPPHDVRPELDEEGQRVGWICYGCE